MPYFLCPIKEASAKCPKAAAIRTSRRVITYEELNKEVELFQGKLLSLGVKSIGVYHPLEESLIALIFAAFRAKIQIFIANTRLPFLFLVKRSKDLNLSLWIVSEKVEGALLPQLSLKDLLKIEEKKIHKESVLEKNYPAIFLFTSGSTSEPKIAALSLGNFYFSAKGSIQLLCLEADDVWLLSLPLFHVSGLILLFRVFLAKSCLAFIVKENPFWTRITHISFVPTQFQRLLASPLTNKNASLKCLMLGGSAIPYSLYEEGIKREFPIFLTYGLTEMSSSVLLTKEPIFKNGLFYLGHPLPFREMQLSEEKEILVKGPVLFQGYFNKGMIEPLQEWFFTKDLGEYLQDIGFAVIGRKDRLFISGGENIQPEEIERILLENHIIEEAYVVPQKNSEYGFVPVAFLRLKRAEPFSRIESLLKEKLPSYKIPRQIFDLNEFCEKTLKPNLQKLAEIANFF